MNAFRRKAIPAMVAATLYAPVLMAEDYDDRFYGTIMGSYVLAEDARETDDGYGGVLALGKRLSPRVELELRGQYLKYDAQDHRRRFLGIPIGQIPDDTTITSGGVGANLFLSSNGGLFLHLDAMAGDATLYNVGLGYDFGGDGVKLRAEALYHIDDDASLEETQFNLGLRVPFGQRKAAAPPPPAPVRVVEPVVAPPPPPPPPPPPVCTSPSAGSAVSFDGCGPGDTVTLHGVNFEFDKSNLTVNAKTLLDQVATALEARPDIKVEIGGHTDSKGSDSYNQKLSDQRSQSVMAYLVERGIAASRMSAVGYGEAKPIADNETDAGRELNRRVELKVVESSVVSPVMDHTQHAAPEAAPPAPAAPVDGGTEVTISGITFKPETLTVAPGTTVSWKNADPAFHYVVKFLDGQSPRLSPGGIYTRSFDKVGSYSYSNPNSTTMSGKIVVANDGTAKAVKPPPGEAPPPALATSAAAPVAVTAPPAASGGGTTVSIVDFMTFSPARLVVARGSTVTFDNQDGSNHIVKFNDGPQSPRLGHGASWTRSFDAPGEYPYICSIHGARMSGVIVVE